MKVGYYKQTINPFLPCHLQGYQDRIAKVQHDNLYLNTIYIESINPILIHVLDVIIIDKVFSEKIKKRLSEVFQIKDEYIFITCIHTHSGPKVSHLLNPEIELDEHYMTTLEEKIIDNTKQAISSKVEALAYIGTTQIDKVYSNRNSLTLPYYSQAQILRFEDLNHHGLFDFVNLACHPTILNAKNLEVSSDFVGVMRDHYLQKCSRPLVFINGECGDVSTRLVRQGQDFKEVERVGQVIANKLLNIDNYQPISLENLAIRHYNIEINYEPNQDKFLNNMLFQLQNAKDYFQEQDQRYFMRDMFIEQIENKITQKKIHLQSKAYIIENDDLRMITIPGEIVYRLADRLRSVDAKKTIIMSYTNDFLGYAVDKDEYGLYFETFMSQYPKGEADKMIDHIIELFQRKE